MQFYANKFALSLLYIMPFVIKNISSAIESQSRKTNYLKNLIKIIYLLVKDANGWDVNPLR